MGLQFGSDKCVKIHVGKKHNKEICRIGKVDDWTQEVLENELEEDTNIDNYKEKVEIQTVDEKKYLRQVIICDLRNENNIRDQTNRAVGNVNKIIKTLNERPFGVYTFQAAKLMRDGILMSSLLNNAETWTNLTQKTFLN